MPYTDQALPFSGSVPQSRHASYQAAVHAAPKVGRRQMRYLELLAAEGPLTDHAAAARLGLPLSSICSLRHTRAVQARVRACGFGTSSYGKRATLWGLR